MAQHDTRTRADAGGQTEEYMIFCLLGEGLAACHWMSSYGGARVAEPVWTMSERREGGWCYAGPLTENGRRALIGHFLLSRAENTLPLAKIARSPPSVLLAVRRRIEERYDSFRLDPTSEGSVSVPA